MKIEKLKKCNFLKMQRNIMENEKFIYDYYQPFRKESNYVIK